MLRDLEKGLEDEHFHYIAKPIKVHEFMDALDDALKILKWNWTTQTNKTDKYDDSRMTALDPGCVKTPNHLENGGRKTITSYEIVAQSASGEVASLSTF